MPNSDARLTNQIHFPSFTCLIKMFPQEENISQQLNSSQLVTHNSSVFLNVAEDKHNRTFDNSYAFKAKRGIIHEMFDNALRNKSILQDSIIEGDENNLVMAELERCIEEIQEGLKKKDGEVEMLIGEIIGKRELWRAEEEEEERKKREVFQNQLQDLYERIEELQGELKDKNKFIEELEGAVSILDDEVEMYKKQLSEVIIEKNKLVYQLENIEKTQNTPNTSNIFESRSTRRSASDFGVQNEPETFAKLPNAPSVNSQFEKELKNASIFLESISKKLSNCSSIFSFESTLASLEKEFKETKSFFKNHEKNLKEFGSAKERIMKYEGQLMELIQNIEEGTRGRIRQLESENSELKEEIKRLEKKNKKNHKKYMELQVRVDSVFNYCQFVQDIGGLPSNFYLSLPNMFAQYLVGALPSLSYRETAKMEGIGSGNPMIDFMNEKFDKMSSEFRELKAKITKKSQNMSGEVGEGSISKNSGSTPSRGDHAPKVSMETVKNGVGTKLLKTAVRGSSSLVTMINAKK